MKYCCTVTAQSLSLFPDIINLGERDNPKITDAEKFNSVFEIINKTRTQLGSALLKSWLYSPLSDINAIYRRQFYIYHFIYNAKLMSTLRDSTLYFSKFPDWKNALNKLENYENKNVTLYDLIIIYRSIIRFQAIGSTLLETSILEESTNFESDLNRDTKNLIFHTIGSNSNKFDKFLNLVEELLDIDSIKSRSVPNTKDTQLESSSIWKDNWIRVRPKFSPSLNNLHESLVDTQRQMQTELTQLNQSLGVKSVISPRICKCASYTLLP